MFVLSHIHEELKKEVERLRKRDAVLTAFLTDIVQSGCWIDKKCADMTAEHLALIDKHNLAPTASKRKGPQDLVGDSCPPAKSENSESDRPVWGMART
jgi:hypothetical protein